MSELENPPTPEATVPAEAGWKKYKGEIGLAVLMLYVFLLGLGTVGELFEIEWILDLPLFRPPGKY